MDEAKAAPLIPKSGISKKSKRIVATKEMAEAKVLYWGNPRPVRWLPRILDTLKKMTPGSSSFNWGTDGVKRNVNK